jgi:di/tricarboxylate transporter
MLKSIGNGQLTTGKNSRTGNSLTVNEHFAIRELLPIAYCLLPIVYWLLRFLLRLKSIGNGQLTIAKNSRTGNSLTVNEHLTIRELLLIAYCLLSIISSSA